MLAISACAQAATSGDLTQSWPPHPEPVTWQPEVGACLQVFEAELYRDSFEPVDCAQEHNYEIVHVGQLAQERSPAREWAECDAATTAYLGGPWRDRQLWIGVSMPSANAWEGGARWFACQAGAATWSGNPRITLSGSIKSGFATHPRLSWGCGDQPETGDYSPADCDEPHNSEFAGSFPLALSYPDAYARYRDDDRLFHDGCLKVIASFVGVGDSRALASRTGTSYWMPGESDWDAGDRSVRCHLWTGPHKLSRSMKGAGLSALPVMRPSR